MTLEGKTALVTGGGARIGAAICAALAGRKCNVVIHYRSSVGAADALAQSLQRRGVRVRTLQGDLATERDCYELMEKAFSHAGRIDFLVNNAAVFHQGRLADCAQENLSAELQINLLAPIFLVREFVARAARGKIVNLLDCRIAGHAAGCLAYQLSKKALAEFTQSMALELAPRFTVNGVAPGAVLPPAGSDRKNRPEPAGKIPLQRRPSPQSVADAVAFLLESDAITGQIIYVDGGQHLLGSAV